MNKPMTGAKFSNAIALFAAANSFFVVAAMFVIIVLGWPWWACSIIMFLALIFGGSAFSSWLYWETTQTAFEALRETDRMLAGQKTEGEVE